MSRDRHHEARQHEHADPRRAWDRRGSVPYDFDESERHPSARLHKMHGAQQAEARQQIRELRSRY